MLQKTLGKSMKILVDPAPYGPELHEIILEGKITGKRYDKYGQCCLILDLHNSLKLIKEHRKVKSFLINGHGMDIIQELSKKPKRPIGMPILVDIYAIIGDIPKKRLNSWKGTEFFGRGEIMMKKLSLSTITELSAKGHCKTLKKQYGIILSYDLESLLKLDGIIKKVVKPPVNKEEIGALVTPWAEYLNYSIAKVFSGELFKDPANGIKVKIKGITRNFETSPTFKIWEIFEQGLTEKTSIKRYIEELMNRTNKSYN